MEMIRPIIKGSSEDKRDETVLNQDELAKYLKVSRSWVDQKISQNEIPYFKVGKYPRFKKAEIDGWVRKKTVMPVPPLKIMNKRR